MDTKSGKASTSDVVRFFVCPELLSVLANRKSGESGRSGFVHNQASD
jgi:hypothetical protein